MNTMPLRRALLDAPADRLKTVIDLLDRPWAPDKNHALMAAWHEARRGEGARRALAYALEASVRDLGPAGARDARLVAGRLGVASPCAGAVADELARRLGAAPRPFTITPEAVETAVRAALGVARWAFAGGAFDRPGRAGRGRPRGHGRGRR
jgi:hypothetical protein